MKYLEAQKSLSHGSNQNFSKYVLIPNDGSIPKFINSNANSCKTNYSRFLILIMIPNLPYADYKALNVYQERAK